MTSIILKLIEKLNSSVFVLILILAVAMFIIYRIGKWTEKFKNQDDRISKAQDTSDKIIALSTKVDLIYQYVNPHPTVIARSPITLTDIGKEIETKIEANKILNKYITKLTKGIELSSPQNAYDIQVASMEAAKTKMIELLSEEELVLVKQEAYNRGILPEDVMSVFGVLLRNYILNTKGMPISDVDKHGAS